MEHNVYTGWTHATKDINEAILGLVSCMEAGYNAWIERRANGDQEFPIMKVNPELDNPFNWVMAYGAPRNEEAMEEHEYLNATEKDLTYNWTACFGDHAAVEEYKKTGKIMEGLIHGTGEQVAVRIEDADRYRREITGDGYTYGYYVTYWKPKDGISTRVVDDSIGDVFTVCYTKGPVDRKTALEKAAAFLLDYAATLG